MPEHVYIYLEFNVTPRLRREVPKATLAFTIPRPLPDNLIQTRAFS